MRKKGGPRSALGCLTVRLISEDIEDPRTTSSERDDLSAGAPSGSFLERSSREEDAHARVVSDDDDDDDDDGSKAIEIDERKCCESDLCLDLRARECEGHVRGSAQRAITSARSSWGTDRRTMSRDNMKRRIGSRNARGTGAVSRGKGARSRSPSRCTPSSTNGGERVSIIYLHFYIIDFF